METGGILLDSDLSVERCDHWCDKNRCGKSNLSYFCKDLLVCICLHGPACSDAICQYGGGKDDQEKVALLIAYLRKMNDDLNIPHCIKNYGADSYPTENGFVPEEVFLERLPEIAANAILDACTGSNPRQPSQEEMEKLLKCCYYDTEVDF